jgi:hypothetical protein
MTFRRGGLPLRLGGFARLPHPPRWIFLLAKAQSRKGIVVHQKKDPPPVILLLLRIKFCGLSLINVILLIRNLAINLNKMSHYLKYGLFS